MLSVNTTYSAMASLKYDLEHQSLDTRFVSLGEDFSHLKTPQREKLKQKLFKQTSEPIQTAWATIGWANDRKFTFDGEIEFSKDGQYESVSPVTLQEIKQIYDINNVLNNKTHKVRERYINFDKVDFKLKDREYKVDELPTLRLTLFLQQDEGAIVYYQHSDKQRFKDSENEHETDFQAEIEYILPEAAQTGRDRLTYLIPILPGNIEHSEFDDRAIEILDGNAPTSFIIKILTFKRSVKSDVELIKDAIENLNRKVEESVQKGAYHLFGKRKYALQLFNPSSNSFQKIDNHAIDFQKRTLLLIHGTFSSTHGSYGASFDADYTPHNQLLRNLIGKEKPFDQIIGFDHPTITHGAIDNAKVLYEMLGEGNRFKHPVSLIGTSRGALFSKHLANDPANNHFDVDYVMTFSGANGVGYFEKAAHVVHFMRLAKYIKGVGSILSVFAQFSADRFLEMPGCRLMTPKSSELEAVLEVLPKSKETKFYCVAADWDKKLVKSRLKRVPAIILDAFIKVILGSKHDRIVSTSNQLKAPFGYAIPAKLIKATHTKVLDVNHVQGANPHEIVQNFFDTYKKI